MKSKEGAGREFSFAGFKKYYENIFNEWIFFFFSKLVYFSSFNTKIGDGCKLTFEWEKVHSMIRFCALPLRFI